MNITRDCGIDSFVLASSAMGQSKLTEGESEVTVNDEPEATGEGEASGELVRVGDTDGELFGGKEKIRHDGDGDGGTCALLLDSTFREQ